MITKFQLAAKNFKVEYVEDPESDWLGRAYSDRCLIRVVKEINGKGIDLINMEQTLLHEVVHCILDQLGYHELSNDETLVQSFSLLLHQFLKTKENSNGQPAKI